MKLRKTLLSFACAIMVALVSLLVVMTGADRTILLADRFTHLRQQWQLMTLSIQKRNLSIQT